MICNCFGEENGCSSKMDSCLYEPVISFVEGWEILLVEESFKLSLFKIGPLFMLVSDFYRVNFFTIIDETLMVFGKSKIC